MLARVFSWVWYWSHVRGSSLINISYNTQEWALQARDQHNMSPEYRPPQWTQSVSCTNVGGKNCRNFEFIDPSLVSQLIVKMLNQMFCCKLGENVSPDTLFQGVLLYLQGVHKTYTLWLFNFLYYGMINIYFLGSKTRGPELSNDGLKLVKWLSTGWVISRQRSVQYQHHHNTVGLSVSELVVGKLIHGWINNILTAQWWSQSGASTRQVNNQPFKHWSSHRNIRQWNKWSRNNLILMKWTLF